MEIDSSLKDLQALLPRPLYVVGGAVRNNILGLTDSNTDVDICGDFAPAEIAALLRGNAVVVPVNPRIGTVKVIYRNEIYEYTCFRKDSYPIGGKHCPKAVQFIKSIEEDALRRDFTVNAIYARVSDGKLIDPTGGIDDVRNKVLRTTRAPQEVFGEDGLRLMRLVRFMAELNFAIAEDTYEAAELLAVQLKDITVQRKREELGKILLADTRYGFAGAHYRGLKALGDLGLWAYIMPEITDGIGLRQNSTYHKYDVYEHTLRTVEAAAPEIRLAALLHDIAKPLVFYKYGNMHQHSVEGAVLCEEIMNRMGYPKSVIRETVALVRWHMFDFDGNAGDNKVRRFVQEHSDILDKLVLLKQADSMGTGMFTENIFIVKLTQARDLMRAEGVPFKINELKIKGQDLIDLNVSETMRAEALAYVLAECAVKDAKIDRRGQLQMLKRFIDGK